MRTVQVRNSIAHTVAGVVAQKVVAQKKAADAADEEGHIRAAGSHQEISDLVDSGAEDSGAEDSVRAVTSDAARVVAGAAGAETSGRQSCCSSRMHRCTDTS